MRVFIILVAAALLLRLFSSFGGSVEKYYSTGIYPGIATILRVITGWVPFSIGDILYAAVAIWLLVRLFKIIRVLFRRKASWKGFWYIIRRTFIKILAIYLIFNILWGLNYDRYGISYQLKLQAGRYSTNDLRQLTAMLVDRVNASRRSLGDSAVYPSYNDVFNRATIAYNNAEGTFPFLHYKVKSIKKSLYSPFDNYFGFLGYYNPFTGEAQVNTDVPPFVIPYTTCHEIAHQAGYGSESEANFVGYLSALSSNDNIFHYSAYFDLFSYANNELFVRDSVAARNNYHLLDTLVKKDYHTYRNFLLAHKNPVEPVIRLFYGEYLKANNQPKGIETYDDVVAWLIAYHKKYGKI